MTHFTNMANETLQLAETLGDRIYLAGMAKNMLSIQGLIQQQIASYGINVDADKSKADCASILLSAPQRLRITNIYKEFAKRYL